MAELGTSSPFIRNGLLSGLPNPGQTLSPFAAAGGPNMGKPATPWAARHSFTTGFSMSEVMHEPEEIVPQTARVNGFVVTRSSDLQRLMALKR